MIFLKMHVYKLLRNEKIDKTGRPAIFLSYFGNESLVWYGTTQIDLKGKNKPIIIKWGDKKGYFYTRGIEKIKTEYLISRWRENSKSKNWVLSADIQQELIRKFSELTNQEDPYIKIALLELEKDVLEKEVETLKIENQNLLSLIEKQEFER